MMYGYMFGYLEVDLTYKLQVLKFGFGKTQLISMFGFG